MATRAKLAEAPVINDESFDFDETTFSAETLNPALESLYAEMGITEGGEATVHISMLDADGRGGEANIWRGDPDNYDLEQIARKFGSGQYRVKVYVRIASGHKVQKGNKVFIWKLSPEDEAKRLAPPPSTQAPSVSPEQIGAMITDGITKGLAAIMAHQAPPPAVDPMAMLTQVMTLAKLMQPAPVAAVDPLDQMRKMAEINALMNEGREAPASGKAGTNDVIITMIDKFGPAFAAVLSQNKAAEQAVQQPQLAAPDANQPTGEDEMSIMQWKLKMGIEFLVQQCVAGGQPVTYAEVVMDSVPVETIEVWTKDDTSVTAAIAGFVQLVPDVAAHDVWFRELMKECKGLLEPEPPDVEGGPT